MMDGSILCQDSANPGGQTNHWWKLTPDNTGSYVNGTWTQLADDPTGYEPLFYASAVLPDGRVIVEGGEYNAGSNDWTNLGAVFNPMTNAWAAQPAPAGWSNIGDAECLVLPNGKFWLANSTAFQTAILDPSTMTWTADSNTGKVEHNFDEEGWTLLPDGTVLTLDIENTPNAEKYVIANDAWVPAGATATAFTDGNNYGFEMGPAVLRYNGQVVQIGANPHTAVYTPPGTPTDPGTWTAGPDMPSSAGGADAPACLLPNGNVLCAVSPLPIFNGTPASFYEYTTSNTLIAVPATPKSPSENAFVMDFLVLPTGQVMMTDSSNTIEIYNPTGSPQTAWRPTITNSPTDITSGQDYTITGTQFNGLSQYNNYGDDLSNAESYPLVRITNTASGHVFYARCHDPSTMAIGTGSTPVSVHFVPPMNMEDGPSTITVVVGGIASTTSPSINAHAIFTKSVSVNPTTVPGGNTVTGTVTLNTAAPVGNLTVNLASNSANAVVPSTCVVTAGNTTGTFNVTTNNLTYVNANATITESYGTEVNHTCALTVNPDDRGTFVSQTVPTSMVSGQSYPVTLTFTNGGLTWDSAHIFELQSLNPTNNSNFGMNRLPLTNAPVTGTHNGVFATTVIAPASAGTFNFQWRPYQGDINVAFGSASTNVVVTVTKNADAARYISRTGATTVNAGADFTISNTMMNVGTNTWSTGAGYSMMSINPNNNTTWGPNRIAFPSSGTTAPLAQVTCTTVCTAPITPGGYVMQWQMDKSGTAFGDTTPLLNITVANGPDNAKYISTTTVPPFVGPGTSFGATFTMENVGTATWSSAYTLVAVPSSNFGVPSIAAGSVAPNTNGTFTGTFTAPATPGTYSLRYRMSHSSAKFGQATPALNIVVAADASQYVTSSVPTTANAGNDFSISYTMKNTGTTTWSAASLYSMLTLNPTNNTNFGTNRLTITGSVAPGANYVFTRTVTAPVTPGTYNMQFQMNKNGTVFGQATPNTAIVVSQGADDATYVSQSVPTSVVHSHTFSATVTMKNTGTATWSGPTYSLGVLGTSNFGVPSISAPSTAPGANGVFTATFTAPATPGTYTFICRMLHSSTRFGQASVLVNITVT